MPRRALRPAAPSSRGGIRGAGRRWVLLLLASGSCFAQFAQACAPRSRIFDRPLPWQRRRSMTGIDTRFTLWELPWQRRRRPVMPQSPACRLPQGPSKGLCSGEAAMAATAAIHDWHRHTVHLVGAAMAATAATGCAAVAGMPAPTRTIEGIVQRGSCHGSECGDPRLASTHGSPCGSCHGSDCGDRLCRSRRHAGSHKDHRRARAAGRLPWQRMRRSKTGIDTRFTGWELPWQRLRRPAIPQSPACRLPQRNPRRARAGTQRPLIPTRHPTPRADRRHPPHQPTAAPDCRGCPAAHGLLRAPTRGS